MAEEQNLNQLLQIRREKLAALQEAGKDPFQITKFAVTHHSTDIKENFEELEPYEILELIGKKRGMIMRGGVVDTERASVMLLDEYRGGKLGKITLDGIY